MTGELVPARSVNGSSASIDASSITQAPAVGERWRPGLRRMPVGRGGRHDRMMPP